MNGTAHLHLVPRGAQRRVDRFERLGGGEPAPGWGQVRLTRRGRGVALAVLVVLAVLTGFAFGSVPSRASGAAGPAPTHRYVVVQPGETLWAIAREAAPDVDPRVTIGRIQDLNALPGAGIFAGQRIALP